MFQDCANAEIGGAMYISHYSATVSLVCCSFVRCHSQKDGGGIFCSSNSFDASILWFINGNAAGIGSASCVHTKDASFALSLNHSVAIGGVSGAKALDFSSNAGGRGARTLTHLNISLNRAANEDAALSIVWALSPLSVTHLFVSINEGDQLFHLDGARLPMIRCITCVHNTGTANGGDIPPGLVHIIGSIEFTECVFLGNDFNHFVTSLIQNVIATFVGCVLPSNPITSGAGVRIETVNCTVQEGSDAVIDAGFCPTKLEATPMPTDFFTPPLKLGMRYKIVRVAIFAFPQLIAQ
jgi:hypothetical protein